MKRIILNVLIILLSSVPVCYTADGPILTPEAGRITDEAISSDISAINKLQKRLAEINTQGISIGTYHFAKAQAWIDMAMDEYTMNDRTRVIEDTVIQAHTLISQLEDNKTNISMDTPVLPTSWKIRPDLWKKAADWKKHPGFSCGEDLVAQLEVQLVWSGHEDNQLGWRHAKPYLQAAERLAKEAGRKIESCTVQAASSDKTHIISLTVEGDTAPSTSCGPEQSACPACPTCLPVVAATTAGAVQPGSATSASGVNTSAETVVADRVHFALNRDIISARSAAVLQRVAAVMQANPSLKLELQGNADERGKETFNKVLSRQRAEVIRTYLVSAGIQRSRITVKAFGVSDPVMRGNDILSYARNRRVVFVFSGSTAIKTVPQYEDVQVENKRQ